MNHPSWHAGDGQELIKDAGLIPRLHSYLLQIAADKNSDAVVHKIGLTILRCIPLRNLPGLTDTYSAYVYRSFGSLPGALEGQSYMIRLYCASFACVIPCVPYHAAAHSAALVFSVFSTQYRIAQYSRFYARPNFLFPQELGQPIQVKKAKTKMMVAIFQNAPKMTNRPAPLHRSTGVKKSWSSTATSSKITRNRMAKMN